MNLIAGSSWFLACGALGILITCNNDKKDGIPASVARERSKQVTNAVFSFCGIMGDAEACEPSEYPGALQTPVKKIFAKVSLETMVIDASVIFRFVKLQDDGTEKDIAKSQAMPVKGSPATLTHTFHIPPDVSTDPNGDYMLGFRILDNEHGTEGVGRLTSVTIR